MADKKINVVFDASVKANVGNLRGIVSKLQNELNNLEIPDGVTKKFEKEIRTLVDELQVFENLTTDGIGNLGDAKKVNASWEKISSTLRKIAGQINDLGNMPDLLPKDVSKNIKQATNSINTYQKALQKARESEEYLNKAREKNSIQETKRTKMSERGRLERNLIKTQADLEMERYRYNQRDQKKEKRLRKNQKAIDDERANLQRQINRQEKIIQDYQNKRILTNPRSGEIKINQNAQNKADLEATKREEVLSKLEAKISKDSQELANKRRQIRNTQNRIKRKIGKEELAKELELEREDLARLEEEAANLKRQIDKDKGELRQAKKEGETTTDIKKAKEALDKKGKLEEKLSGKTLKADDAAFLQNIDNYLANIEKAEADIEKITKKITEIDDFTNGKDIEIAKIDSEMLDIEQTGAKEAWADLIQTLQQIPNLDVSNLKSLEDVQKVLNDYKVEALKKVPEALQDIKNSASGTAGAMKQVDQAVDGATNSFKDLTREQQDMERFKDNILDFFSIGNTVQIFKSALRDAFDTVKELDAAMTETAVVTDFSIGDMWEKLPEYSKTASELGSSIKDLYGATTLYYQQGLNTEQAMSVGIETMKMARIANMEGADATKAMTAALRGFNMEINETSAKRVNDVYSELAAITAADTQQIATAMTKTASIADSANMDFEVTAALLAQIIETTQEAPETAGTALKTIIARFTEVKELFSEGVLTGKDSEGEAININKIDAALQTVGISLKDFLNGSKGIDDIFLELASKWDTLDLATQRYIATTAAGSRQQSRFIAMMSNYDRTMELVGAANDSAGASNEQFDKTLDSLDAKLERLNNAWQEFTMNLANNELIKFGVDFLADFLETVNSITEALSGGNGMIKSILTLGEVVTGLKTGKNIFNSLFRGIQSTIPEEAQSGSVVLKWLSGGFSNKNNKKGLGAQFLSGGVQNLGNILAFAGKANNFLENPLQNLLDFTSKAATGFYEKQDIGLGKFLRKNTKAKVEEAFNKNFQPTGDKYLDEILQDYSSSRYKQFIGSLEETTSADDFLRIVSEFNEESGGVLKDIFDEKSFWKNFNPLPSFLDAGKAKALDFGKALVKAFTSPLGKLSLLVGAGAALYKTWEHFNLDNQEKRAQENLKEIKSAASNEKDRLNQLSEEKTNYQAIRNELDNLVEGSLEWKQAVSDLNEKTLELKSRYSDLKISKDGSVFSIDDLSWDDAIDKQQKTVDVLENTKIAAQMEVDEVEFKKTLNKIINDSNVSNFYKAYAKNILPLFSSEFMANQIKYAGIGTSEKDFIKETVALEKALYDSNQESRRREMVEASISDEVASGNSELITNLISKGGISWGVNGEYNDSVEGRINNYTHTYDFWSENALQKEYAKKIGGVYKNGKLYTDETYSEEITLDRQGLKQVLATNATMNQISEYSEQLNQGLNTFGEKQKKQLGELFSSEGQGISIDTLRKFYQDGELNKEALETFAQENGFGSVKDMAKKLGMSADTFYDTIESNLNMAKIRVEKQRKNVVKNLSQYGNTLSGQVTDDAAMLALLEAKFGDYDILGAFDSVISSLEATGDTDLIAAGLQGFQTVAQFGTQAEVEELKSFISDTNWNNPIEAASALNEELETGSGLTKTYAQQLLDVESSYLGAGSQMRYFWETSQDSELGENINELIEANGELGAADILGLASEYKVLDKMLKNTGVTAEGVAKALEALAKGEINTSSLTDSVVASLKGLGGLDSLVANVTDKINNFDLGLDEGQVTDFNASNYGIVKENLDKGAYGNSQVDRIFDFYFGDDWDQGATNTDELKKIMDARAADLAQLQNNMRPAWQELADMEDQSALGGMSVTSDGKEITLTGYEGLTTDEIVSRLQEATGKSREYAEMMLTDFKNYSLDLAQELQQNDLVAGVEEAYKVLGEIGSQKWIDQSEIDTIAKLFGVSPEEVLAQFQEQANKAGGKLEVTNFYDEKGNLKETQEILNEIGKQQNQINDNSGKTVSLGNDWVDQLKSGLITVDELKSNLAEVGVPKDKISQMTEDIVNGLREADGQEVTVKAKMPDGSIKDITVKAGQSFEEAYNQAVKEFDASTLADAIAAAFTNFSVDPNTFAGLKTGIETAVTEGQKTDILLNGKVDASTVSEAIISAINTASNTPVNLKVNPATVTVTGMASGTVKISAHKDGIVNAPVNHPALVGEEGPELVETANGAYLAGVGGPEVTNINKGDTVHTAQETKKILKGNKHKQIPRFAKGYGDAPDDKKGGGGGGKDESWENNIDKLYNLVQEISEEQRQRERIERRYELLLEGINSSAKKIIDISHEELAQLKLEKQLQENLIAGRLDQLAEYQQENSDLTKYAWTEQIVQEDGKVDTVLRINWEEINKITDKEEGERVSKYLSQLEDWNDSINEGNDTLADIEETILDIKRRGKEEYFELEETIKDALIQSYQNEIDILSEIDENINETNSILIDSIQNSIEKMRQEREFQETEEDLETMRRRLAYLQQDTSNANALEILNLQKEISEQEEDYTDSLIDQKISQLQEQNEKAQEQRQMQIEIAQLQLEHYEKTGEVWSDVYKLMDEGLDEENGLVRGSHLETLLREGAGYTGLSEIGKMNWLEETNTLIANALAYFEIGRQLEDIGVKKGETIEFQTKDGKILSGIVDEKGNVQVGDKLYTNVFQGYDGKYYAGDGIEEIKEPDLTPAPTPTKKTFVEDNTGDGSDQDDNRGPGGGDGDKDDNTLPTNYSGYINAEKKGQEDAKKVVEAERRAAIEKLEAEEKAQQQANQAAQKTSTQSKATVNQKNSAATIAATTTIGYNITLPKITWPWQKKYATGGLADFTGPAWLDGTKSRPEYVLNAEQTKNFFNLVDVLDSLKYKTSNINTSENGGEIIYDIDINIETVKEEADIDMLVDKVQKSITTASQYRNNTLIQR